MKGERNDRVEEIMKLVFVTKVRPALAANFVDSVLVEPACLFEDTFGQRSPQRNSAGTSLFQAGIIEEGIWIRIDQFVCELRRHGSIDGEAANGSIFDSAQHFDQALKVHRFLKHILHNLIDQRVGRNLDIPDDGFKTGGGLRKHARQKIFGACALDLRSDSLALREAKQLQAASGSPAPAGLEDG